MIVQVKLFAAARQLAGADCISVDVPAPATVGQVRQALISQCPSLENLVRRAMFAVNTDYAADQAVVSEGAEVACIPPVSGG